MAIGSNWPEITNLQHTAMSKTIVRRRLRYIERGEVVEVDQDFLRERERPLILLGEAGMGKSTLLRQLGDEAGFAFCTARKLSLTPNPEVLVGSATTLVIDALDEVSARREGDVVDQVLGKLSELGLPHFVLSCRVADWRSATAIQGIADLYDSKPLEIHIEALNREDALAFLAATLDDGLAEEVINHLEARGLEGLWRNPQTLELVGKVAANGRLPTSKGDLFEKATKLLREEHRPEKGRSALVEMSEDLVLKAAGAGFAALILAGKEAISREVVLAEDDLRLAELTVLPDAACLGEIVDSRLFEARAPERFTYAHRAIGEFVGARWLAGQANTARKRRRLLQLLNGQSLVPASLRGIHAWLAWHSQKLALQVIAADPMGVIEYGDADALSPPQAKALLEGLYQVSRDNPLFRTWSDYRAESLVHPAMREEIRKIITSNEVEFGLRLLVLQTLNASPLTADLIDELRALLFDEDAAFALRREAANRLDEFERTINWPPRLQDLLRRGTEDAVRLVSEIMSQVGYERFTDTLVIDMVKAQMTRSERTFGVFYHLERLFPAERLDSLLDGVASIAKSLGQGSNRRGNDALTDLAFALLGRRLAGPPLVAERLWSWLQPFNSHFGARRETRAAVAEAIQADDTLRRAIQRHVLLGNNDGQNIWQLYWKMLDATPGLQSSEEDIVALLALLGRNDARWRELLELARHGPKDGGTVRAAGALFAEGDADAEAWLAALAQPHVPDWQINQEERERRYDAERRERREQHRKNFAANASAMRAGEFGMVINPALAYLKLFYDVDETALDGPGRLAEWLGPDLRDAALAGFEAFLTTVPPMPTAFDIADSYAEGKRYDAVHVIVAGLAERMRTGRGFDDLTDERLMAGHFELTQTRLHKHAGVDGLDSHLTTILKLRGCWEEAKRALLEPQITAGVPHITGLYALMRNEEDADLALSLGAEWLERFPEMSAEAEIEIIDYLLSILPGRAALSALLRQRLPTEMNRERQLTWIAIAVILDFEKASVLLEEQGSVDPALLWSLRARQGGRSRRSNSHAPLGVQQLEWALQTFRPTYPFTGRPNGVTSGDANIWDASEYLVTLINLLGDETSAEATQALVDLRDAPADGYTWYLRIAAAEQRRKRLEVEWTAPDLSAIAAVVADGSPTTAPQLQAVMIEELSVVQRKVRSSDVNWRNDFFLASGSPRSEEECRNVILKMLGELPFDIQAYPESHLANGKRCDIACTLPRLMVPIEVKGQWNRGLWTAADRQLDLLYTNDWRAERGIYLVLWFGNEILKKPQKPPAGVDLPTTAKDLQVSLAQQSATTREGRTEIIVLDLT